MQYRPCSYAALLGRITNHQGHFDCRKYHADRLISSSEIKEVCSSMGLIFVDGKLTNWLFAFGYGCIISIRREISS